MTDIKTMKMASTNGLVDKSKELQKEILMERLRSKPSQFKNLTETAKAVRMAFTDKRWGIDTEDRLILQRCLDSLQHCIKVSSLQSLIERLDCLSRQLGLKFVIGQSGVNLFISSDMFYLEILVESDGSIKDVKIHHEGKIEQQSCEELVACITRGDFTDFTAQLEGLTAVYQLNAEKKVKTKAFTALTSLEEDLCTMKQLQGFIKDPWAQVHKSPIGFLVKRRGGHAMRLTYFVSPYELLDKDKGLLPLTTELLTVGKPSATNGLSSLGARTHTPIGSSATVLLEGSAPNQLQLLPIITGGQRSGPVYAPLVPQNSAMLPACFTLRLPEPMPLCSGLANLIHATTNVEVAGDWASAKPMLSLVAQQAYNKLTPGKNIELNLSKGLFVKLVDVTQCYFLVNAGSLTGAVVSSLGFTHPAHVAPLLAALRQQALFNHLLATAVRPQTKHAYEPDSVVIAEVSAVSWQHISVSLEQPGGAGLATLELELAEPAAPRARLYPAPAPAAAAPAAAAAAPREIDEYVTRVLQKTLSIPVTLRALVKIWEREAASKQLNGSFPAMDSNFRCGVGGLDPGGAGSGGSGPGGAVPGGAPQRGGYTGGAGHTGGTYMSEQQHQTVTMCNETGDTRPPGSDERKSKKRKSDPDPWSAGHKRGKLGLGGDSDSESEQSDASGNDDENTHSTSSNGEPSGRASSASQHASDAEPADPPREPPRDPDPASDSSSDADLTAGNSFQRSDHKRQKLKSGAAEGVRSSLLLELAEGKAFMPASVSITPLSERRAAVDALALPSSITITPIAARTDSRADARARDRKKRRRRDDAMGPPGKPPPKPDPLTKQVTVTIKPAEPRPASPGSLLRKLAASPTPARHHGSPRPLQTSPKPPAGYSSPRHGVSSPKHASSGSGKPSMSALKSAATHSPSGKSASTGYDLSRKPSKESSGSGSSSSSRDKEKKHSGLNFSSGSGRSSPKLKNPLKMKALEITPVSCDSPVAEPLVSPPNVELSRSSVPSQVRNRKGSLSAVIDKLKSAQHCGSDLDLGASKSSGGSSSNKFSDPKNGSSGGAKLNDTKNQEYMVKPSSDGMKITINKTRTKEVSSGNSSKLNYGSSSSGKQSSPQLTPPSQGSPKTHTGLKPGVISGPASKKTQAMQSSKSSSLSITPGSTPPKSNMNTSESSPGSVSKVPYSKSSSGNAGMNLSKSASKSSSGSPKSSSTDMAKIIRDREREKARAKLNTDKSIFSKSERHSSPSGSKDDVDGDRYKNKDANFLVEGLMKPLDCKFQIPKLKNQNASDKNSPISQYDSRSMVNDFSRGLDQSKYSFTNFENTNARSDSMQKTAYPLTVPKPLLNMGSSSPKTVPPGKADQTDRPLEFTKAMSDSTTKGESPQRGKEDSKDAYSVPYPLMPLDFKTDAAKGFPVPKASEDRKGADSGLKPPASGALAVRGATTPQEAAEMLLDFSSSSGSKVSGLLAVRPVFPRSPAPGSPHSAEPAITDDELMDEALVGPPN